jgi:uncharacterized repeat protein (TIGR03806 family)
MIALLLASLAGFAADTRSMPPLNVPRVAGAPPLLLSETGLFQDLTALVPANALLPYDLNVGFWSDGALKQRWLVVPSPSESFRARIGFREKGEWSFPAGTIFVKHFELVTDESKPNARRRLETRVLVKAADGGVSGFTYKWRADNREADLLATNLSESIVINTATGSRTQVWYYPSRDDCRTCHTSRAGGVLGPNTRQLNRAFTYPDGAVENQLRRWNRLGLFDTELKETAIPSLESLALVEAADRPLTDRARSYLDANCANCHRPGGTVADFDARYDTPLAQQGLIDGEVLIDEGIDHARIIAPNDVWRSILLLRLSSTDALKMPPLAHSVRDERGTALLKSWIESLPGPPVLAPPTFRPAEGNYSAPIEVTLQSPADKAEIHYTLDGSVPTEEDPVYQRPIRLVESATVRAKAFEPGHTRSITAQRTYIIGQ